MNFNFQSKVDGKGNNLNVAEDEFKETIRKLRDNQDRSNQRTCVK